MGKGLEVIGGAVTNPGAVFTAWTNNTGNSNQIRSADVASKILLLGGWGENATAGTLRVRSPRLHDFQQGIRMRIPAANGGPQYPGLSESAFQQVLIAQDTLTIEQTGGAAEVDSGTLLIYYDSLPGIAARLIASADVRKFGVNIIGQEVSVTTTATGNWSGQVAINSAFDNFKANTDYALLGGMTDTLGTTVRIQGVDTGNLGVGYPANPSLRGLTNNFFAAISDVTGYSLIPVFNSANKTGILVDVADNLVHTHVVTLFMVELQPNSVPGAVGNVAR
jgi:hypothetical protein